MRSFPQKSRPLSSPYLTVLQSHGLSELCRSEGRPRAAKSKNAPLTYYRERNLRLVSGVLRAVGLSLMPAQKDRICPLKTPHFRHTV
jgi:hypothetical protein